MKICYAINSLDGGGGAFPVPNIVQVMRGMGHEVFVVSLMERDGRARPPVEAAGIDCRVIGGARREFLRTAGRFAAIVRAERPDLIWTSLSHATVTGQVVGKLLGVPVASWLHNAWLKPANARIMRRTQRLSRHWIADSQAVARFGTETLGIAPDRFSVWPIFQADPAQPPARAADEHGAFVIGSLGRLHRNKGYHVLVEALALLQARAPDAARRLRVRIGGEGPERAALTAQAAALGVANLDLAGFVEPNSFLAGLNAYVQPSHHEGFCIAAHEALCAGLPVIASPVGEIAASVTAAGAGRLTAYGDASALADAIAAMIGDPAGAARMAAAGRAWAMAQFAPARFAARGEAAIAAVLAAI